MKNYFVTFLFLALLSLIFFSSTATSASEKTDTEKTSVSNKPVTLKGAIRPYGRTGNFIVTVRFDMGDDWHTYKDAGESGGQSTSLTLKLPEGAKAVGDWASSSNGSEGFEQSKIDTGRVDFTRIITFEPSAYGKKIEVTAFYQACNSKYCNPPATETISIAIPGADTNMSEAFEKPVRLMVKKEFLNTEANEKFPSPAIMDIDGDGKNELVIGSLSGHLGIYENLNTSGKGDPIWDSRRLLKGASGAVIKTRNWCCVGASAQLVDMNGDGRKDILVRSFSGVPQWLMNTKDGFGESTHIRDKNGKLVSLSQYWDDDKNDWIMKNGDGIICSSVAAVDWDDDGDMDLLLGGYSGEALELRLNEGVKGGAVKFASSNQPVLVGGKPFSFMSGGDGGYGFGGIGTPRIADWNGDGLFDILIGTIYGEVVLLENTGSKGSPKFSEMTTLVEPFLGRAGSKQIKRVPSKNGLPAGPGSSFHIEVVDYDGDGDLDLLVGARSEWLVGDIKVPTAAQLELKKQLDQETKLAQTKMMQYEKANAKDGKLNSRAEYKALIDDYHAIRLKALAVIKDPIERGDFVWLYRRK